MEGLQKKLLQKQSLLSKQLQQQVNLKRAIQEILVDILLPGSTTRQLKSWQLKNKTLILVAANKALANELFLQQESLRHQFRGRLAIERLVIR